MENPVQPADSPPTPPQASPFNSEADLSGQVVGDFKLLRRLGQGGMGQVYLAEQFSLRRQVALKIVRPELADSATAATLIALQSRGRGGGAGHARQHRADLLHRPGRRPQLHGPGIRRGPQPPRAGRKEEADLRRDRAQDHGSGRRRSAACRRAGHGPPRHQTREYPGHAQRWRRRLPTSACRAVSIARWG